MSRELTKENLEALAGRNEGDGQLLAIIVTPTLLAEMLGKPMNASGDIVLDSVSTFDEYLYDTEREYLAVTPIIRLVQRNASPRRPEAEG